MTPTAEPIKAVTTALVKRDVLYRLEDPYPGRFWDFEIYEVIKKTPQGYWISDWNKGKEKRWVANFGFKRFAYPTKQRALESYIKRKERQIRIMQARRDAAVVNLKNAIRHTQQLQAGEQFRTEPGPLECDPFRRSNEELLREALAGLIQASSKTELMKIKNGLDAVTANPVIQQETMPGSQASDILNMYAAVNILLATATED